MGKSQKFELAHMKSIKAMKTADVTMPLSKDDDRGKEEKIEGEEWLWKQQRSQKKL